MDPRAAQTREALETAILALAAERPLDDISVTDLVARAGVHRSSFYQHFSDRAELLATALETAETTAGRVREAVTAADPEHPPAELIRFLSHFAEHASIYRSALGPQGSPLVAARVKARTLELVREGIELTEPGGTGIPLDIMAAGTTGALLGVIEAWLARDPLPPVDQAADWMWRLLRMRLEEAGTGADAAKG